MGIFGLQLTEIRKDSCKWSFVMPEVYDGAFIISAQAERWSKCSKAFHEIAGFSIFSFLSFVKWSSLRINTATGWDCKPVREMFCKVWIKIIKCLVRNLSQSSKTMQTPSVSCFFPAGKPGQSHWTFHQVLLTFWAELWEIVLDITWAGPQGRTNVIFAVEGFLGNMLLRALSPSCHPSRILQLPLLPQVLQGAGMSPLTSGHPRHRPPLFPAEQRGAVEILKLTHPIALFPLIYLSFRFFFPALCSGRSERH